MSLSVSDRSKVKAAKIPRPMNAFMIFAKEHRPKVKKEHPQEENHVISIRLGNMWASLSKEEKDRYQALSREAVNEHRRKYPDYRYEPKPKIKKKRRYDQYLLMDKLRTAAAESAREQKEEQEKAKQTSFQQSTTNMTSISTSYTAPRPSWGIPGSSPAPNLMAHYHPEGFASSQGYYSPHPNIIPAHSQPSRSSLGYGPAMTDPYNVHYTTTGASPDVPLDMTRAGNQYKTQMTTEDTSGKVYCNLTTPAYSKTSPVPMHFVQNWSSRMGCQPVWGDPIKMAAPLVQQVNANHSLLNLPQVMCSKRSTNQNSPTAPISNSGEGKTDLIWIPCEADFAKKLGWSVDPSLQEQTNNH